MKEKKKRIIVTAAGILILLLTIIGATYAYFAADLGGGTNANINASTGTTDSLTFDAGDPIRIHASLENFAEGMESLKGSTTATATLKANNTTNEASGKYNIFFIIDANDFVYSTVDGQAELVLKVTDPNGNEVEEITGLKKVENGFDITTRTGGFLVRADYEIETTSTIEQTWNIEVTLVNLNSDQNINMGKTLNGRFYITTEQEATYELAEINTIEAVTSYNSITANLNTLAGTSEIDKYYYAIQEDTSSVALLGFSNGILKTNNLAAKELNYIESDESTHTFDNLKPNTSYKLYSYVKDKQGINSNVYETNITTAEYVLPKVTGLTHTSELYKITVTATSEAGSNEVSKYYFSKDNGATWSEGQESATYVFDNLLDTTTYNIKVKVSDTEDKYSTEYYEAIATSTYINPSITTVTNTKTYNSITLTATATKGTNEISKYYFSKDNGATWTAGQASNVYTYTGLNENTAYNIKVKVEDTNGRMSNPYSLSVTTNTYKVPSVTATTTKTSSSITVSAKATKGDGNIAKYMYSKDGGSNWTTQTSTSTTNSYTFSGLTSNTAYSIRVKVVDSNNRESSIYSISVTTDMANFTNSTSNISGTYNGSAKSISVSVSPSPTSIYYSTSTQLTASNYSNSGTTTNPSRTTAGTTTVYWCAVKNGYNIYCSSNTITISKASPTFTVSSTSSPIGSSSTTSSITYTYTGDGTVRCAAKSPTTATYASCSVNTSTKRITFTRKAVGTQTFTISASAGTNYSAGTSKTVTVTVAEQTLAAVCAGQTMSTCFKNNYTKDSNLYYHSTSLANSAGDNSYRYSGADPNNYVCFGSTASTCPNDNLYRIIGIFGNQVKLIKSDYATINQLGTGGDYDGTYTNTDEYYKGSVSLSLIGIYYWNGSSKNSGVTGINNWNTSRLNKTNLNTTFLNTLGTTWSNKIASTVWYVGGIDSNYQTDPPKTVYQYELGSNRINTTYNAKIGLMYISDYGFASSEWTYFYNGNNWMYMGLSEWTMTRYTNFTSSGSNTASAIKDYGYPWGHSYDNGDGTGGSYKMGMAAVRPVFYLNSTVTLSSGNGTKTSPYRVS